MKKIKYLAVGMMMFFALALMPQKAFAAESIGVTQVKDITDVQTVPYKVYQVGRGAYQKTVQFTLKKQAYVYIGAYSTVMHEDWEQLGKIQNYAVYSDPSCSNLVYGGNNKDVPGNTKNVRYTVLDAGTYYIHFSKGKADSYNPESDGEFKLSVAAEYLNTTAAKNGSRNRAKTVSTDKNVTGVLSNSTRTAWYRFNVASNTAVKISASLENSLGESRFPSSSTGVTLYRSNNRIYSRFNISDHYFDTAYSGTVTLPAGTYYIAVNGNSSYGTYSWNNTKLLKNDNENMGVVNLRITTVKKAAIQSLKNVRGKKAQTVYKSVSGAKGYQVQYALDSRFKKSAKTLTTRSTKVTLSRLAKNKRYYVRVRAYKYDADGNKVYGAWSNAKNVKISK